MTSGVGIQIFFRMAALAILARIISPTEFGIVGAALMVVNFTEIFSQVGVSQAVIQKADLDAVHIRSSITFSVLLSSLFGIIVFLCADRIAQIFGIPGVAPAVELLSIIFPLAGFSSVGEALLLRWMQFKRIAVITLISYILGYAMLSTTLALMGWGVNALIFGQIAQEVVKGVIYIYFTRQTFGFGLNLKALQQLVNFSGGISLARLATFVSSNIDNFLAGRMLGAAALGLYSRAFNFMMMPTQLMSTVLDRVLYSGMATIQHDDERMKRAYIRSVALIALTIIPLSVVMVVLGPEIIRVALGPKWMDAVVPFQLLSSCLLFRIGYKASAIVARAKGAVYRNAWRQWLLALLIAIGAWCGHYWGINGIAAGVGVALIVQFLVMVEFGRHLTGTPLSKIVEIHFRHGLVAVVMAVIVFASATLCRAYYVPAILTLFAGVSVAAATMVAIQFVLPKLLGDEGRWLTNMMKESATKLLLRAHR